MKDFEPEELEDFRNLTIKQKLKGIIVVGVIILLLSLESIIDKLF